MKRWSKNFNLNAGVILPKIAAIVSVYNRARELRLCLEGYRRQSFLVNHHQEFQLILADDGSDPEIENIFADFAERVSFPATFLRQEHSGWGKLRMLNWAVLEAQAKQIVFADGDCVPHRDFVQSHFDNFDEETVWCGRRVDLGKNISALISPEDVRAGKLDSPLWLLQNMLKDNVDFGGV